MPAHKDSNDSKDPKTNNNQKSSIAGKNSKSKLHGNERSSMSSNSTIQTTMSEIKDPKDFLHNRGYQVVRTIAEGGFAVVYEGRVKKAPDELDDQPDQESHIKVAIKVFNLTDQSQAFCVQNCFKREMFISKYLKHPNIVQTFEVLKTHLYRCIVMELAPNGSIKHDIVNQLKRPYTDGEAKRHFRGLCTGLQYMHSHNIAHRDLKLDNFLLSADNIPMIADFGFAARGTAQTKIVLAQILRKTRCGTKGYMAPELCRKVCPVKSSSSTIAVTSNKSSIMTPTESASSREGFYDAKAVDIFAMGVSLFEMLNLVKPYSRRVDEATMNKIVNQEIVYSNPNVEDACKELISAMLKFTADARPKVNDVLQHKWMTLGRIDQ